MKRKLSILAMVAMMVFSFASVSYATELDPVGPDPIAPEYVATQSYEEGFTISKTGLAGMDLYLCPKLSANVTRVSANVKLYDSSSNIVYNKTSNMTWSNLAGEYYLGLTKQLPYSDIYEMDVVFKVYSGTTLLETINAAPMIRGY